MSNYIKLKLQYDESNSEKPFEFTIDEVFRAADREITQLKILADERNMISELINDDNGLLLFLDCAFSLHDAHSFWSCINENYEALKSNDS